MLAMNPTRTTAQSVAASTPQLRWTIFARHLQWLTTQAFAHTHPYDTGVLVGEKAQQLGFHAVDLTVRPTGLVDTGLADFKVNLPLMLNGLRSTGAVCEQITTNIELPDKPIGTMHGMIVLPESLLSVAHDAGIRLYRGGSFSYSAHAYGNELIAELDAAAERLELLAALNRRYSLTALYHTFSGGNGARSVWDLMRMLERLSVDEIAINFDIGHMVREGALSAWNTNLRYAMPRIRGIGLKDGMVVRNANGVVSGSFPSAGSGMVQWQEFFRLLLQGGYRGPAEAQYEYDTTGVKGISVSMNTTFWADHAQFVSGNLTPAFMTAELKRDMAFYRAQAALAGWSADQMI